MSPGPLIYKDADPQHKGRGTGWYYYCGRNRGWSKYSKFRDGLLKRGPYKVGGGKYKHTMDYKDYTRAPSYPTNKRNYMHVRTPSVMMRMKNMRRK